MNEKNAIAKIILWIGIIQIILGFITAFTQDLFKPVTWIVSSTILGMLIIGFSEIINLLAKINASLNNNNSIVIERNDRQAAMPTAQSAAPIAASTTAPIASPVVSHSTTAAQAQGDTAHNNVRVAGHVKGDYKSLSVFVETPATLQISKAAFSVETITETIINLPVSNIVSCSLSSSSEVVIVFHDEHEIQKRLYFGIKTSARNVKEEAAKLMNIINAFMNSN